jgi:hypothetical protein
MGPAWGGFRPWHVSVAQPRGPGGPIILLWAFLHRPPPLTLTLSGTRERPTGTVVEVSALVGDARFAPLPFPTWRLELGRQQVLERSLDREGSGFRV